MSVHALFPGTFDPLTIGHVDLIERAAILFDRVTVGLAEHPSKACAFSLEERIELVRASTSHMENVEVRELEGLVVDGCRELGANVIVRGVRSGTDFDYELQMAGTNRELLGEADTVLLATAPCHAHISSTLVRQIAAMGGDPTPFVPEQVAVALRERYPL
jgi:pantetheine-phosphate adenylyltransferase